MSLFIVVFAVMLLIIAAMSVGVMMGRKPIKGSCGGASAMVGGSGRCELCGDDPAKCDEISDTESTQDTTLANDIMKR